MELTLYDRSAAVEYAKSWAMLRNPSYYNFDRLGGDCTNFVSQCIFAGSRVMNHTKDTGWYYTSLSDRAAAWSASQYLYNFLTGNRGLVPYAVPAHRAETGDIIFLNNGFEFYHSLIVTGFLNDTALVCAHTDDSYMRPVTTYNSFSKTILHIQGVRK